MDSSMIGKIEKAKRYAAEANRRVVFQQFRVRIEGDNNAWIVSFDQGIGRADAITLRRTVCVSTPWRWNACWV